MDYIKEKFAIIEDNRHSSYVEHSLTDILIIIMCAVLCGLDELADITTYAQSNAKFLKKKFNITKIPSKATFSRILNMMDADKVASVIIEIMHDVTWAMLLL
ncbi:transposase family protein [Pectinatus frisingensis]|uniref:transposase family protein n=1 Tax=Pectinatus frisingensis TaxID=865 RepID=UPI0018C530F2|nr:transposase family protein [Pectinatus frisingensis]